VLVTSTEFKTNISKYLALATKEDIFVTKNGRRIARISNPNEDKVAIAKSLFGIIPGDTSEDSRGERLSKHERID